MIIWSVGGIDRGSGMSKGMMEIRSVGHSVEERDNALWASRSVAWSFEGKFHLWSLNWLVGRLIGWVISESMMRERR